MAHKYMSYSRDASGLITRNHQIQVLDDISDYFQRETLIGWPERFVFWRFMADGSAVGIAPMTERVLAQITSYQAMDGFKLRQNNSVK